MTPSERELRTFGGLRRVIARLRSAHGCPWDRVQTHQSLRPYLLEEACETLSALDHGNPQRLCEELGDLLLEVLLHVRIAEENREFKLSDVVYSIAHKLVRRHPHVFGDAVAETPEAVMEQWDRLKREERGQQTALAGIPEALPALAYAQALQRRAHRSGFAFQSIEQVWEALEEELRELRSAQSPEHARDEVGDALFALVNLARWLDVDAEDALRSTCRGFSTLFQHLEGIAQERSIDLTSAEMEVKLRLWEEAKARRWKESVRKT
jgi:tetrapyrrole methylase family protein/MazG family protein